MGNKTKGFLFKKVNRTSVIPVQLKIVVIFVLFILVSNLTSNYINLMQNRNSQIRLMKMLLAKDLKDIYSFANTQYEIYQFNKDLAGSFVNIANKAAYELKTNKASLVVVSPANEILASAQVLVSEPIEALEEAPASKEEKNWTSFDSEALASMNKDLSNGVEQGFIAVRYNDEEYFGIYKYNKKWDAYFVRAEEYREFTRDSRETFKWITIIILGSTFLLTIVGIFVMRHMLRYINIITNAIMKMVKNSQLELIPLSKAPNDDITYLGMAFNSLSGTIDTLLTIFKKFTNQDIAYQAYKEKNIRLEGTQKELTILFSDIKGFTTITETLGTDIIKLINLHYDRAIREIVRFDGTIGSIIGDALLAMFGTMSEISTRNKSLSAIQAAYEIHAVAEALRLEMTKKKEALVRVKGGLTSEEERVYQAVLIQVGVGIDGGQVFYGNIGSYVRMTNTVIGDNVNSASRLEGLTREYKVPVICSDYVKDDIENNVPGHGITFVELDLVQVKGKTEGKRVFWPVPEIFMTKQLQSDLNRFERALRDYYDGKWSSAHSEFSKINLPVAEIFKDRTLSKKAPANWKGIWTMKTK